MLSHEMHKAIATKLEQNPALLQIALDNIDHWMSLSDDGKRHLLMWRERILRARENPEEFRKLMDFLRSPKEDALEMQGYTPFPGVLDKEESNRIIDLCVYSH
ncbi:MAG: hypothetical protein SFY92_10665 [Verrucomicrobiae bacterium]|nr:hypothetical protein [Verrucomicrobiae bacterium]